MMQLEQEKSIIPHLGFTSFLSIFFCKYLYEVDKAYIMDISLLTKQRYLSHWSHPIVIPNAG